MLELHFIRTMLDILDFNIVFQGEKEELNCNIKCIKNLKNLYRQRITQ